MILRCIMYFVVFSFLGLSTLNGQVTKVKFFIQYSMTTCTYDACVVFTEGSATTPVERAQFNSQYTLVVPTGSTFYIDTLYAPFVGNQNYDSTTPTTWSLSNFVISPCAQPQHDFYAITPSLNPASFYNDLETGDTVKLFGVVFEPTMNCMPEIRPFDNMNDPSSSACGMGGSDYSNGYTIGGSIQKYDGNIETARPPAPAVTAEINCGDFIEINVTPTDTLGCKTPFQYSWSFPNGGSTTNENVYIPNATASDYGDFYLTLIDDYGCDSTLLITVELPPDIEPDETVCEPGAIDLIALFPTDGVWTLSDANTTGAFIGGTSNGEAVAIFDATASGDYFFEYSNGGCVVTKVVTVQSAANPPEPTAEEVCEGETIELYANFAGADAYEWRDHNGFLFSLDENPTIPGAALADGGQYCLTVDVDGCLSVGCVDVVVNANPTPSFNENYGPYCIDEGSVLLEATPSSGTFSGDPAVDASGNFDPSAGAGTYTILYEYTDSKGCYGSVTQDIEVNDLPTPSFDDTYGPVCIDESPFQIEATPPGGVYTGPNVSPSGEFTPSDGAGTHTIEYLLTDGNDCQETISIDIVVNELPTVSIDGTYGPYCIDEDPIQLLSTPSSGGDFSGGNVSPTGTFTPSDGAGTHTVTYQYTDGNNCLATATIDIIVHDLPTVSIDGTYGPYCIDEDPIQVLATPNSGGTFSGNGIDPSGLFSPANGAGTHTITFTYTDGNSCENSTTIDIVVNELPTVSFDDTYGPYCIDADPVQLSATPGSGTFSGNGVDASGLFTPATATDGTHAITYEYTDANSCTQTTTIDIIVNPLPEVTIDGTYGPYCINDATEQLLGSPTGGTFSGTDIDSDGNFTPNTLGTHTITYEFTDGEGCTSNTTVEIIVNDLPTVSIDGTYGPYCIDAEDVQLVGNPIGGSFSGDGISSEGLFSPANGAGTHTITYVFEDANLCLSSATIDIVVNDLPEVTIDGTYGPYCVDASPVQLVASPSGGTFSGDGIDSDGLFGPSFGAGTHTITYTFIDGNSCENSATIDIIVNSLPTVTIDEPVGVICHGDDRFQLDATPADGTFSGNGVTIDGEFNPGIGAGMHTIIYEFTDTNGCTNSDTIDIDVTALPAVEIIGSYGPYCEDDEDVQLMASPAFGSYSGDGISNLGLFSPSIGAGTYTVTYTASENGCENYTSIDIIVHATPTVTIDGTYGPYCNDDEIVQILTTPATGGTFTGSGVNPEGEFDPASVSPGTYTITYDYEDGNTCGGSASVDIIVNEVPTVTIDGTYGPYCEDEDPVQILATPNTGSFSGDGVSVTGVFTPSSVAPGSYDILYGYTDGEGCFNSDMITIVVNEKPTLSFDDNYGPYCESDGEIQFSASPGPGTFSGNGVYASGLFNTNVGSGTYTVTYSYTDGNNCSAEISMDIIVNALPTAQAESNNVVCEGEALTFSETGGDAVAWSWNGPGLFGDNNQNPSIGFATLADAGTYTVEVTDVNGCVNTSTVDVTVNALPAIIADNNGPLCEGETLQFDEFAGDATGWLWNGPGLSNVTEQSPTIPSVTEGDGGTYNLVVTDVNGCTSSMDIFVEIYQGATVAVSSNSEICEGGTLELYETGGNAVSWLWTGQGVDGDTNQNPSVDAVGLNNNGTYSVQVTNANGCTEVASVEVIVNPLPGVKIETNSPICEGEVLSFMENGNEAVSWSWSGPGFSNENNQNPSISFANASDSGTYTVTITDSNGCTSSESVDVVVHSTPAAIAESNNAVCGGETLIFNESGGDAVTWLWNGPGLINDPNQSPEIPNATVADEGNYIVVVTDVNGCTNSSSVSVSIFGEPSVNVESNGPICEGETLILDENGGDAVAWLWEGVGVSGSIEQNPSVPVADISNTGTYYVTITDANGCESSSSVDVTINTLLGITVSSNGPVCEGENITLSESGGEAVSWIWNGPGLTNNTEQNPTISFANTGDTGLYTVEVTDVNGCRSSTTIEILINQLPGAAATSNGLVCEGNDIELYENGGDAISWSWTGPSFTSVEQNPIISGASTANEGEYTVEITDANGCKSTTSTIVSLAPSTLANITSNSPVCIGNTITFDENGGDAISWIWSGPGIDGSTDQNPSIATSDLLHNTTYTVEIEDNNGCRTTASIEIIVNDIPNIEITTNGPICEGETLEFNEIGGNAISWIWNGPGLDNVEEQNPTITFANPGDNGEYTVTVTDNNGCTSSATIDIEIGSLPNAAASSNSPICEGLNIELYENGGDAISWSWTGPSFTSDEQNPIISGASTANEGEYVVEVTDVNGCKSTAATVVSLAPTSLANISSNSPVCIGESITFDENGGDAVTWLWSGPGIDGSTDQNPSIATSDLSHNATYTVEITDSNGCKRTASTDVTVYDIPSVEISTNGAVCEGEKLEFNEIGGDAVSWEWDGSSISGSTDQNPSVDFINPGDNGTYSVTITDVNGCTNETSIEINIGSTPNAQAGGTTIVCVGDEITLTETGGDALAWSWTGPNFTSVENSPIIPNASLEHAGEYVITVTDGAGCTNTSAVSIIVNPTPEAIAESNGTVCTGETITFAETGTGAVSWSWTGPGFATENNNQNPEITNASIADAGVYTVTVENADGCSHTATIEVIVNQTPDVDAGSYADICDSDAPINLEGTPANGLFTGDGVVGNTFDPSGVGPGTFEITYEFTTVEGCINSATTEIIVLETPELSIVSIDCSADLNSYTVTFSSTGTVSATEGSLNGNQIEGISISENVVITSVNAQGSCAIEIPVSAPQCDCEEVDAAVSGGDIEICFEEATPSFTMNVQAGITVDWYDVPVGGIALSIGQNIYTSPETGVGNYTYYAEARNEVDGCISSTRTPVSLAIKEVPSITNTILSDEYCEGDMSSGFELMSDVTGTVYEWTAIANNLSGHSTSGSGNIPSEMLSLSGTGSGSVVYTVSPTLNGCVGSPEDFTITVNPMPMITVDAKECSADLSTYTVTFDSDATVDPSHGTVSGNQIIDIPAQTNISVTISYADTGCESTLEITAPNCDCDEVPAPIGGGDQEICFGEANPMLSAIVGAEETVDWYDASGSSLLVDDNQILTLETAVGSYSYFAEARNTDNDCVSSSRTEIVFTIHELPSLVVESTSCTADLSEYTVVFNSSSTVDPSEGTVAGNEITGIAAGTDITLTLMDPITGCESTMEITAPNCDCDEVPAPIGGGDQEICFGDANPMLSAIVGAEETVDWFDASGTPLLVDNNQILTLETAVGSYSYFAEARNIDNDCVSSSRTEIVFTIHDLPSLVVESSSCSADLTEYTVVFNSSSTVDPSEGTVVGNEITGIPAATNITLTLTDPTTGCESTMEITAPNCDCDEVPAPIGGGDQEICFGDANPMLSAIVGAEETVDWYDASGTPLLVDNNQILTLETAVGSYSYFAEARNIDNDCVSSSRTEIVFTIHELPSLEVESTSCTADLTEYSVIFNSTATINPSVGTVAGNEITGIATGTDVTLTLTDPITGCESTMEITAPNCDCDEVPAPIGGGDQEICFGDANPMLSAIVGAEETVDWYDASGTQLLIDNNQILTLETAVGSYSYFAEARNTDNDCISSTRTEIVFTIHELPSLVVESSSCSADLTEYTVVFNSISTVDPSEGTVAGNEITGISVGTNITLTLTDPTTGCESTMEITAPNCDCDEVEIPISGGDQEICFGEVKPELSMSAEAGVVVDWYDVPVGGTSLATGFVFTSPENSEGVYTYYAEARNEMNSCLSSTRTEVVFTIHGLPEIDILSTDCSADLSTYSVTFSSVATIDPSAGTVVGNQIIDIPKGTDITITISDDATSCTSTVDITALECACDMVDAPISDGNEEICLGETIPALSVTTIAGTEVNWYDAATGGNELATNSLSYTPVDATVGVNTYYVQAVNTVDGCLSEMTEITLTINALPEFIVEDKSCASDLLTYSVTFSAIGNVSASAGTIVGNQIIDIPDLTNIDVDVIDPLTGCSISLEIIAPNCDCDEVLPPVSGGDPDICFGDANPVLEAATPAGISVNWYDASTGGSLVLGNSNSMTPTETAVGQYCYYAEAMNDADGCISNSRTLVCFTIHELPEIEIIDVQCSSDLLSYSITYNSVHVVTSSAGTIVGNEIIDIPQGMPVAITVENTTTTCKTIVEIEAPACDCDDVEIAISGGDKEICFGETNPELNASILGADLTINWYDAAVGGTLLLANSDVYTITDNLPGLYTVYAVGVNTIDNCQSNTRTPVRLTIHALPEFVEVAKDCSADLTMYNVSFTSNGTVTTSHGTLNGTTIENIPANQDVDITITDSATGCINNITIVAPQCDCDEIMPPVGGGDQEICFGEANPMLTVFVGADEIVNWYNASGSSIGNGTSIMTTELAPGVYSYFAEAENSINGCISTTRTELLFTINALPKITNTETERTICANEGFSDFILESDLENTTFTWISTSSNVTGNTASGNGDIISEELQTLGSTDGSVVYTVTPFANGCAGEPVDFVINVLALPRAGEDQEVACIEDAIFTLDAEGSGIWTLGDNNPGNVLIVSNSDAKTEVRNFSHIGDYEFIWTSTNGCSSNVMITIGDDCPCFIDANNILDPLEDAFCMTTGELMIEGQEGVPAGGAYTWMMSKDKNEYVVAPGISDAKDYDASNLGGGTYLLRRVYTLTEESSICVDTSNITDFYVYDDKFTPGDISYSPSPLCTGDTLMVEVDYNPVLTYEWRVTSGNARVVYSIDSMSMVVVESPGMITIQVTQSFDGCSENLVSSPATVDVIVNASPQPFLGQDTTYCEIDETIVLTVGEYDEYTWQDGSYDNEFEVEENGIYSVTVKDSMGCEGTDVIDIKSFCCDFAFPNIFVVDATTGNDEFQITDIYGCAVESELKVFDRWGNMVYVGPGIESWDGYYKGDPVAQGVYVFIYTYIGIDADRSEFEDNISGDITVIRRE